MLSEGVPTTSWRNEVPPVPSLPWVNVNRRLLLLSGDTPIAVTFHWLAWFTLVWTSALDPTVQVLVSLSTRLAMSVPNALPLTVPDVAYVKQGTAVHGATGVPADWTFPIGTPAATVLKFEFG